MTAQRLRQWFSSYARPRLGNSFFIRLGLVPTNAKAWYKAAAFTVTTTITVLCEILKPKSLEDANVIKEV
jgi:hypothetical protein